MVMIGGLGTLVGPIIGGTFFIVLQEKVSSYVQWYNIVVGLVLVLIVLFAPRGLVGLRDALRGRSGRQAAG
jgi:branched-chain amino acid transport system permease protein